MEATRIRKMNCCAGVQFEAMKSSVADQAVARLKALAHPVRLQIMHILSEIGAPACACDLEEQFDLKQPTISHHLKVLRQAGLVETDQRGTWIYYSIRRDAVRTLERLLAGMSD